jgi:hypothetical protein
VPSSAQGSFVPAQNYSYEQPAAGAGGAEDEFGSEVDEGDVHSDRFSDASEQPEDGGRGGATAEDRPDTPPENSWDATGALSPDTAVGADADGIDMNASLIPQQSAFDMSMPSYVSHINSSSDANQSYFDDSYRKQSGQAASDEASLASQKLSVGSDDSIDQLNSTVAELVKRAPSASVTYNAALAEADAASSSEDEADSESGDEESEGDDQHSQSSRSMEEQEEQEV